MWPLASVIVGGLVTATFLILFVLPVLYSKFSQAKIVELTEYLPLLDLPTGDKGLVGNFSFVLDQTAYIAAILSFFAVKGLKQCLVSLE